MSRYYQSSYHGSNDYKKYRQEKLKNYQTKPQTSKSSSTQYNTTYQFSHTQENTQNTLKSTQKLTNYDLQPQFKRNPHLSLKNKYPSFSIQSTNINDDNIFNNYQQRQKDQSPTLNNYVNNYERQTNPSNSKDITSKNDHEQIHQATYRSKSNSRFGKYDKALQFTTSDNFEDSVISRRKDYRYQNIERKHQPQQSYKNYNYSSKVKNLIQSHDQVRQNNEENYFLRKQVNKVGERNYLNQPQAQQRGEKTTSYQSRNQMTKQRLNLNSQIDPTNSFISKSNFKQQPQQTYDSKATGFTSRYLSNHTTPQKSNFTAKEERDLSQQRRKSLIEKSQMLKQKLNKLNTSSNKLQSNQEIEEDSNRNENFTAKQNITSQGYTPPKRYGSSCLKQNRENSQLTERSISKKLDFDLTNREPKIETNYDSTLKESNLNSSKNYLRNYQHQNVKESLSKNVNQSVMKSYENQEQNDGALKKIQELNERINSRLQSILKNYG